MPNIIVPQRRVWARQPHGICAPSEQYSDAVAAAAIVGEDFRARVVAVGSPARQLVSGKGLPGGMGYCYSSGQYHTCFHKSTSNVYTLIVIARIKHTDTNRQLLDDDDVSTRAFQLRQSNYAIDFIPFDTGGSPQTISVLTNNAYNDGNGIISCVIARARAGETRLDTSSCGSASGTLATIHGLTGSMYVGAFKGAPYLPNPDGILGYMVLPRFVPDAEVKRLLQNPWQIFSKRDRYAFVSTGGGGTTSVYADSALTYYIRSMLSSDSGVQYAIRNAIYKDDEVGYYLRSSIEQNNEVGYILRAAIAKDDAEAYKIRGLVQSSDAEAYKIRGLVQTSDGEAYKIRSQVQADASASYDIQSSTSVASSNAVNYSVRGAVAASAPSGYSVRGSAQKDVAATYSVRSAVSRDVVASYSVSASASSVYADSTVSYSVDGVVPSCPSAESIAAAVLAALQATTIPVNIKQVNDVTVQGAGTKLNPWQPV